MVAKQISRVEPFLQYNYSALKVMDYYNINRINLVRKPKWIKKKNLLYIIYSLYSISRLIVNLILQCSYLSLQSSIGKAKDPRTTVELQETIKWVQSIMVNIGQIHRADGTSGVFFYSICIAGLLTYTLIEPLSEGRIFDFFNNNEILLFLAKPTEADKVFSQRINDCLKLLIYSNENYTRKIVNRIAIDEDEDEDSTIEPTKSRLNSMTISNRVTQPPLTGRSSEEPEYKLRFSNGEKVLVDFDMLNAEVEMIEALRKQREYLIKLKSDLYRVWPSSRKVHKINELKKIGSITIIVYGCMTYILGQTLNFLTYHVAYSSLATSSFDPEYSRFTLMDRLQLFEYHIFTYFVSFSFVPHASVYLVTIFYQLQQLRNLWSQTDRFYEGVKRCELWQRQNKSRCSRGDNFILNEQTRRDLKFECDKSMIELYISYYMFRKEVQPAVETTEIAANQIVFFIISCILPMAAYLKYVSGSHWLILTATVIVLMTLCDLAFLLCAFFCSACNKFARHAWSILAFVEGHNYELNSSLKNTWSPNSFRKKKKKFSNQFDDEADYYDRSLRRMDKKKLPDYIYHNDSFITPHSMALWQNLIKSHRTMSDGFAVKLFGIFNVNYSGTLKFNHWLVWASLIAALYQQ